MNTEEKSLKVYELKEICELLKINLQVLRRYIKNGDIKASKIGRKYVITEANLQDFIKGNEVKTFTPTDKRLLDYLMNYSVLTDDKDLEIDLNTVRYIEATGRKKTDKQEDLEEVRKEIKEALDTLLNSYITIETDNAKQNLTLINKVVKKDESEDVIVYLNKDAMSLLDKISKGQIKNIKIEDILNKK